MSHFLLARACRRFALVLVSCWIGHPQAWAADPLASVSVTPAARIAVDAATIRLEMVKKGEAAQAVFAVRNTGAAPLTLVLESTSCGNCLVAEVPSVVAAGSEGKIAVRVNTASLDGAQELILALRTNDPESPVKELAVQIVVDPWLETFPGYARYIYVQHEVPGPVTQVLWSVDGADFRVLSAQSPYEFLRVEFREALAGERRSGFEGRQWIVVSTIQPTAKVGDLRGELLVRTDHPRQSEVRIPLSGFVRPVFAVTPEAADFGQVPVNLEKKYRLTVTVANYATELIPVEISEVIGDGIEALLRPVTEGRRYQLDVRVKAETPGPVRGRIVLKSNSPKASRIEVPVVLEAVKAQS